LRWFNQLEPRINRGHFTEEEEERLLAAHLIHGNKWALITRLSLVELIMLRRIIACNNG